MVIADEPKCTNLIQSVFLIKKKYICVHEISVVILCRFIIKNDHKNVGIGILHELRMTSIFLVLELKSH